MSDNERTKDRAFTADPSDALFAEKLKGLSPDEAASFHADSFGRVIRLTKIELVTIISATGMPGVAHGASACTY